MRQLYVDLDGVLADFDSAYDAIFEPKLPREFVEDPPGMWENIKTHGSFFLTLPLMPDALDLWEGIKHLNPVVLSGIRLDRVPDGELHKRAWVEANFGNVRVICCRSEDKRNHAKPGDVLIDDRVKYRQLWLDMGGVFLLHTSAKATLQSVRSIAW